MSIDRHVNAIHDAERRRDDARTRMLTEDLGDSQRSAIDAEIFGLNLEIERHARLINEGLRDLSKKGAKNAPAIKVSVSDPELKAFLEQVKMTCDRIRGVKSDGGSSSQMNEERQKLAREREKAAKFRNDSNQDKKELTDEQKKVKQAFNDLKKERARLKTEQKKVAEERAHIEKDKDKLDKDKKDLETKIARDKKERVALERERKELANRLRRRPDAKTRAGLELRAREITNRLTVINRQQNANERSLDDRVKRVEKSMGRELGDLEKADDQFKKELARLDEEEERLHEREKALEKAVDCTDERLETIGKAEAQLKTAL